MKHSDQTANNVDPSNYPPPPAYSPPGQDPHTNIQMQMTGGKQYGGASAPPPPPIGIHAPGFSMSSQTSSTITAPTTPIPASHNHHHHHQQHLHQQSTATATTTPTTVVYTNSATVNPNPNQFGPYPMRVICPFCNAHIMTETHSTPGLLTYVLSGALCFLAGYLLCCLIPCCVRECKDIEHRCPSCHHKLGLFKRI